MRKWSDTFDMSSVPDNVLKSEWARRNNARRIKPKGGRPKSADRCPCRKYTIHTAQVRRHKCEVAT
jgi:hypothetical protein